MDLIVYGKNVSISEEEIGVFTANVLDLDALDFVKREGLL